MFVAKSWYSYNNDSEEEKEQQEPESESELLVPEDQIKDMKENIREEITNLQENHEAVFMERLLNINKQINEPTSRWVELKNAMLMQKLTACQVLTVRHRIIFLQAYLKLLEINQISKRRHVSLFTEMESNVLSYEPNEEEIENFINTLN